MPFTFSHPAAVLMLNRRGLRFSALAIGSMTPDFPYFFKLAPTDGSWHHFPGAFTWAVLGGVCTVLLYERVLRAPLIALLPRTHEQRLRGVYAGSNALSIRTILWTALAVLIGIITHLAWDSATHSSGFTVRHVEILRASVGNFGGRELYVFKVLQHASTVVGGVLLATAYWKWVQPERPRFYDMKDWRRAIIAASIIVVPAALALPYGWKAVGELSSDYSSGEVWIGRVVIAQISFTFWALLFYAVLWRLSSRVRVFAN